MTDVTDAFNALSLPIASLAARLLPHGMCGLLLLADPHLQILSLKSAGISVAPQMPRNAPEPSVCSQG